MKEEYERLLDFEHQLVQHVVPPIHRHYVKLLHKHIMIILTVPTRLLMDAIRQFGFHLKTPGEEAAKQILKVLCATFADNKIVEDVVRSAFVLETRGMRHPAKLTKAMFLRDWKNPKKRLSAKLYRIHEAGRHKMGRHCMSWARRDWVQFRKRLWSKVQQLGDGFNIVHLECVHLM